MSPPQEENVALIARDLPALRASPDAWVADFERFDDILNKTPSATADLVKPAVADTIMANLDWLRGRDWRIWAACVMPSHIHLVLGNTAGQNMNLNQDLGQFKNFTARAANELLGLTGTFWQREVFDHWCRNSEQWLRFVHYTAMNPVRAGLATTWRSWRWTRIDPETEKALNEISTQ